MNVIGKSKQVRYLSGQIVAPLGYVRHRIPLQVSNDINKYTVEGRKAILNSCAFLYTENTRNKIYEDLLKDIYNYKDSIFS